MDLPEIAYQIVIAAIGYGPGKVPEELVAEAKAFLLKQFESQLEVQEVQKEALRKQLGSGALHRSQ